MQKISAILLSSLLFCTLGIFFVEGINASSEMSSESQKIIRSNISGGGNSSTSSGNNLTLSVGEIISDPNTSTNYKIYDGFWNITNYPGTITTLVATSSNVASAVNLTWIAPGADGTIGTVSKYIVKYSSYGQINTEVDFSTATEFGQTWTPVSPGILEERYITGLPGENTYYIKIEARNAAGLQAYFSTGVVSVVPITIPGAITDLSATLISPFTGIVQLQWSAPSKSGGGAVSEYRVRYATSDFSQNQWGASFVGQALSTPTPSAPGIQQSMNISALASGQTYYFHIRSLDVGSNLSNLDTTSPSAQKRVEHILISEVMANGSEVKSEFVELHNPATSWFTFSNWRLTKKTSGGLENNLASSFSGSVPPKGYFLIGSREYNLSVSTDASYTQSSDYLSGTDNTVLIYSDAGDTLVDKVGYGSDSKDYEVIPASNPVASGSIERKAYESSTSTSMVTGGSDVNLGNGFDANNNNLEFSTRAVAQPQNSNSSPEPDNGTPSQVTSLFAQSGTSPGTIRLTWLAPGDDATVGTATTYIIKMSTCAEYSPAISDAYFDVAENVNSTSPVPSPLTSGSSTQFMLVTGLMEDVSYYFAIKAEDEFSKRSSLSNGATAPAMTEEIGVIILGTNTYNFGLVDMGVSTITVSSFTIRNVGNVRQDYLINGTTITPNSPWQLSTTSDIDKMILWGGFSPTRPENQDFGSEDIISYGDQTSSETKFAIGTSSGTGVPINDDRYFWIKAGMPLITSTTEQQTIQVTITGSKTP